MARYTIIYDGGQIYKDNVVYSDLNLSWLPSDILAVQSPDGVTASLEKGERATNRHTVNDEDVATSSLSWWSNVDSTWQAAYDAEQAAQAAEGGE